MVVRARGTLEQTLVIGLLLTLAALAWAATLVLPGTPLASSLSHAHGGGLEQSAQAPAIGVLGVFLVGWTLLAAGEHRADVVGLVTDRDHGSEGVAQEALAIQTISAATSSGGSAAVGAGTPVRPTSGFRECVTTQHLEQRGGSSDVVTATALRTNRPSLASASKLAARVGAAREDARRLVLVQRVARHTGCIEPARWRH